MPMAQQELRRKGIASMGVPFCFERKEMKKHKFLKYISVAVLFIALIFSPLSRVRAADDIWSMPFKGRGSDYITFRSYMTFEVFDNKADPTHEKVLTTLTMQQKSGTKTYGIYTLSYKGVDILTYNNQGDESILIRSENFQLDFYQYLYNNGACRGREEYYVRVVPVIKVFSRDSNHVGPYNGDGWNSLEECEANDWAVIASPEGYSTPGRARDGSTLNGKYGLNDDQESNIRDIFATAWDGIYTPAGSTITITYDANGGSIDKGPTMTENQTAYMALCTATEPVRPGYYFWGWSTTKYAVDKGPRDYNEMIHAGCFMDYWKNTTLYAVWGTTTLEDAEPLHIHNFVEEEESRGVCPTCGQYMYRTVYRCECGKVSTKKDIPHTCPPGRIYYQSGICTTCGELGPSNGGANESGNRQVIKTIAETGLTFPGHTFVGWNEAADGSSTWHAEGSTYRFSGGGQKLNLYAIWTPNNYTVHFDYMDNALLNGSAMNKGISSKTVSFDDYMTGLPSPTLNGFTFQGWYSPVRGRFMNGDTRYGIAKDSTVEAQWSSHAVTVYTDMNFPAGSKNQKTPGFFEYNENSFEVDYGTKYSSWIPLSLYPSCDGYDFLGWTVNNSSVTESTMCRVDGTHTLKGKWSPKVIKITLDPGLGNFTGRATGESLTDSITYKNLLIGSDALPTPEREGYMFDGWYTDYDGQGERVENGEEMSLVEDTTLRASWIARKYVLTFDYSTKWRFEAQNLAGNSISAMIVTYNERPGEIPEPSRYGYRFLGWSDSRVYDNAYSAWNGDRNGEILTDALWTGTSNKTFYAIWEPLSVTVTYDFNYDFTEEVPITWPEE